MAIYPGGIVAGENCTQGGASSYATAVNITRDTISAIGPDFFKSYSFTRGFSAALLARVNKTQLYAMLLANLRPCTDADNADRDMNGAVCLQRNGLADNHNGGGLETIGGIDLVHNLVLQSRDGVLRFFPWLSVDFRAASFRKLRALGGFTVSASYTQRNGVASPIYVTFPSGQQQQWCEVEVPAGWGSFHVCAVKTHSEVVTVPAHGDGDDVTVAVRGFWGDEAAEYLLQAGPCKTAQ